MKRTMFFRRENGTYNASGSKAEIDVADVQQAVEDYNKAKNGRILYFDAETMDVILTDEFPAFIK